jgi:hypothetical protein
LCSFLGLPLACPVLSFYWVKPMSLPKLIGAWKDSLLFKEILEMNNLSRARMWGQRELENLSRQQEDFGASASLLIGFPGVFPPEFGHQQPPQPDAPQLPLMLPLPAVRSAQKSRTD